MVLAELQDLLFVQFFGVVLNLVWEVFGKAVVYADDDAEGDEGFGDLANRALLGDSHKLCRLTNNRPKQLHQAKRNIDIPSLGIFRMGPLPLQKSQHPRGLLEITLEGDLQQEARNDSEVGLADIEFLDLLEGQELGHEKVADTDLDQEHEDALADGVVQVDRVAVLRHVCGNS